MSRLVIVVLALLAACAVGYIDPAFFDGKAIKVDSAPIVDEEGDMPVDTPSLVEVFRSRQKPRVLPADVGVDENTPSPFEILEPKETYDMPENVIRDHLPGVKAPKPALRLSGVQKEFCKAFDTPQERIDVGCTWRKTEKKAIPVCQSSHTPSSLMGGLERCNPDLFNNLKQRVRATLHGVASDCSWVVVNDEPYARLFCEPREMPVLVDPKGLPKINPEACAELQRVAGNGIINVGCEWKDRELAPSCHSRLTPRGAMSLLKDCDTNAFENVFAMAVKHIRGEKTDCKWSMTPTDAVLVTSNQVLLCPFVTEKVVKKPVVINKEMCAALGPRIPNGMIPVGCTWVRVDHSAMPKCLSTSTPNEEMSMLKECDEVAYRNVVDRVRSTMLNMPTDCKWQDSTIDPQTQELFCSVVPEAVVVPAPMIPTQDHSVCDGIVARGFIRVGCTKSVESDEVSCLSHLTPNKEMDELRVCDVRTWRILRKHIHNVAAGRDPAPCYWNAPLDGRSELECSFHNLE